MMNLKPCIAPITHAVKWTLLLGAFAAGGAFADEAKETMLRDVLLQIVPYEPDFIQPSPIPNLYEVAYGSMVVYITEDGKHVITEGNIYDLSSRSNLTEATRSNIRAKLLEGYGTDQLVVFPATGDRKHVITVVTDTSCVYCQKFHQHIEELNDSGVEVRYLLFSRAGQGSQSYNTMVNVWCSDNRQVALTKAKQQEPIPPKVCANPVSEHMELVDKMQISSTPSIITDKGGLVRGYRPPNELLGLLGS